jgi:predicted tellurium resistance membrane protein TerC
MYVFGAILIYTVRSDPFIVYTSNIFAILGLRAMYFLLLRGRMETSTPLADE